MAKLTRFQANYIRVLFTGGRSRRFRMHSWRAAARVFTTRYKNYCKETGWFPDGDEYNKEFEHIDKKLGLKPAAPWSSGNQLLGQDLMREASDVLGIDIQEEWGSRPPRARKKKPMLNSIEPYESFLEKSVRAFLAIDLPLPEDLELSGESQDYFRMGLKHFSAIYTEIHARLYGEQRTAVVLS